tara:strand:+ start:2196 stop:3470 length:1275 start_codon:yes stop_codon:yes gene_type:complete
MNINYNFILSKSILIFLVGITLTYSLYHTLELIDVKIYAYNELFINYEAGFVRRGLLGQIFFFFYKYLNISPRIFFGLVFSFLYLIQIILFFKVMDKFLRYNNLLIIFSLSPIFLLFNIYDPNIFFVKDIFIKISILLHALIFIHFSNNKDYEQYIKYLKYFIVPFLIFVMLVHEYQIFFVGFHLLISLGVCKKKNDLYYILRIYSILLIPFILLLLFIGTETQYNELNKILSEFNVSVHPQLKGGLYTAIGGFYKWHFFYFNYDQFIKLFFSLLLGIFVYIAFFNILKQRKIIYNNSVYQNNYFFLMSPSLLIFILAHIDHGRNISLIAMNLIIFFTTLNINNKKLSKLIQNFNNNLFKKYSSFIFIFFYIFLWKLDQYAGYSMRNENNTIFQSSLFAEFVNLIKFIYNYIDTNLVDLPEINL